MAGWASPSQEFLHLVANPEMFSSSLSTLRVAEEVPLTVLLFVPPAMNFSMKHSSFAMIVFFTNDRTPGVCPLRYFNNLRVQVNHPKSR